MKQRLPLILKGIGSLLLAIVAVLYWRPILFGWTLSSTPVGMLILAVACFWLSGELTPRNKPPDASG